MHEGSREILHGQSLGIFHFLFIHSGRNSMVVEISPCLMSLEKASNLPSYGVVRVKEGITYSTTQRNWMRGLGISMHTIIGGCSERGSVVRL